LAALAASAQAADAEKQSYNLPSGDAAQTLTQFAKASGRPIMFVVEKVRGERTNAVAGMMSPAEALQKMLTGTMLRIVRDEATGTFVVSRQRPNEPMAPKREGEPDSEPSTPSKPTTSVTRSPRSLVALVAGLVAALPADGQTAPTPAANDSVVRLSEFHVSTAADQGYRAGNSVSATRIDTPIKNLPFAINAFTQQFIEDTAAGDLQDIVKYAPGVTGAGREFVSGNTRFNIRGFDTTAPQRNGFSGARYVDPANIQRVEVVKGPASLLYGAIEPGGTVNYITKKPFNRLALHLSQDFGSLEQWRSHADLNVPLVPGKLQMRIIGAYQNGPNPDDLTGDTRWVITPSLTWQIARHHAITVDYDRYRRDEQTPYNTIPSIVVVSHNISTAAAAADPTAVRRLTDPVATTFDYGILQPFPLPKKFNWTGADDWRESDVESLNAEYTGRLSERWTVRANAAYSRNEIVNKATGIGDINAYAPGTADRNGVIDVASVPGATVAAKTAYLDDLARAFAARVLANPNAVFESPYIFQVRRKRITQNMTESRSYQAEVAGNLEFPIGRVKPLFGAFRQDVEGDSYNRQSTTNPPAGVANSATTPTQNLRPWNYLNLDARTRDESYDESLLPLQASATNGNTNTAYYAVLNGSFLSERLYTIIGARHTRASAESFNRATNRAGNDFDTSDTSWQGGAGYKLQPDVLVFASYSESFVPSNTLLSINGQPAGSAVPVISDGLEFGLKTDFFSGRVSSTISYFDINQTDRISRFSLPDPITGTTLSSVIQGTDDRSTGVEIDLTLSPTDNWQIYTSFSHINARTVGAPPALAKSLGKKIENSAERLFNVWTRYNIPVTRLKGLWIGAGVNYTSEKKLSISNPDLFFPAVTLWDAALGYSWKSGKASWTATAHWKNITDETHLTGLIGRGLPRRAWLSVSVRL
jgi:iron complex outermembrane receptor protein